MRRADAAPTVDGSPSYVHAALQRLLRHIHLEAHAVHGRAATVSTTAVAAAVSAERLLNAWPRGQPIERIGLRVAVVVAGEGLAFVPTGRRINHSMRHVDEALPALTDARVVEGRLQHAAAALSAADVSLRLLGLPANECGEIPRRVLDRVDAHLRAELDEGEPT